MPALLAQMAEGLFIFVLGWTLLFAPLLFKEGPIQGIARRLVGLSDVPHK